MDQLQQHVENGISHAQRAGHCELKLGWEYIQEREDEHTGILMSEIYSEKREHLNPEKIHSLEQNLSSLRSLLLKYVDRLQSSRLPVFVLGTQVFPHSFSLSLSHCLPLPLSLFFIFLFSLHPTRSISYPHPLLHVQPRNNLTKTLKRLSILSPNVHMV